MSKLYDMSNAATRVWSRALARTVSRPSLFDVFATVRNPGDDLRDAVRAARVAAGLPVAAAPPPVRRDVIGIYNVLWIESPHVLP